MDNETCESPSPHEKLSIKFILDEIRDRKLSESELGPPLEPSLSPGTPHEATFHAIHAITPLNGSDLAESPPPVADLPELPAEKKYFRIGEVSELVGVEPYVLRYWESEFRGVRPVKTSAGHRVYARRDVEMLGRIRQLLHVEKFSIKGAKRALSHQKLPSVQSPLSPSFPLGLLREMAVELKLILQTAKHW